VKLLGDERQSWAATARMPGQQQQQRAQKLLAAVSSL